MAVEVLEETDDGFRVAEKDLEMQGPGELAGTAQSGMPNFQVADLVRHQDIGRPGRGFPDGRGPSKGVGFPRHCSTKPCAASALAFASPKSVNPRMPPL